MRNSQQIIQLAYERALFKLSALGQCSVQDAIRSLEKTLAQRGASGDYSSRRAAHQFLLHNGDRFLAKFDTFFRDGLERAMRTMYIDLRRKIGSISADNLTLIDDETINRIMDVDRLVQRLRDADPSSLSRLNIMIAQLHGDHEVRERENPFRPYLLARSLYEALWAMKPQAQVADVIFGYLSNAMVAHLPEYFSGICDVFESSGVHAKLLARPATLNRMQRLELAQHATAQGLAAERHSGGGAMPGDATALLASPVSLINQDVMASLQHMLALMQHGQRNVLGSSPISESAQKSTTLQDFVSDIFNRNRQSNPAAGAYHAESDYPRPAPANLATAFRPELEALAPASSHLIAKLAEFQEIAARGASIDDAISVEENQLFAVRDDLGSEKSSTLERVTIDVVASLFAFILEDDQIPPILRVHIGRLQIPFLKAALLAPDLLRQEHHPARQLLNRMGSLAIGIDPTEPDGRALSDEIARIAGRILDEFYEDTTIFTHCLDELNHFIVQQLRHVDSTTASSIEEIEQAEETSALPVDIVSMVRKLLTLVPADERIVNFILHTWTWVLMQAVRDEVDAVVAPTGLTSQQACELLPDLVWSAQEKNATERSALLRLLPGLINRVKSGLHMIGLPDDDRKRALDTLFDVHSQILRDTVAGNTADSMSLDALQLYFAPLAGQLTGAPASVADARAGDQTAIPDAISLNFDSEFDMSREQGQDWLAPMQVGIRIERWANDAYMPGRLVWLSMRHTLFMFKMDGDSKPMVYSSAALVKALREGSVQLIEYACIFDRAVESLLIGTENIQPQSP